MEFFAIEYGVPKCPVSNVSWTGANALNHCSQAQQGEARNVLASNTLLLQHPS